MPNYRKYMPSLQPASAAKSGNGSAASLPDLQRHDGRVIAELTCRLYFIGSEWNTAWKKDGAALEEALRTAVTDVRLNSVFAQYMPGSKPVTTGSFPPSAVIDRDMPLWVMQQDIDALITDLLANKSDPLLAQGASPDSFAVLFVLPQGRILVAPEGFVETSMKGEPAYHNYFDVPGGPRIYYAVSAWADGGNGAAHSGWPAWKNVCAALYHEVAELRTDPDMETKGKRGWYVDIMQDNELTEIADLAILAAGDKPQLMLKEVSAGSAKVPIQLLWSNAIHGPWDPG